jgi:hypothetical protein
VTRLDNRQGTGFLPRLLETERELFALTDAFLQRAHNGAELADFQRRMAEKALAAMRGIE